MSPRVSGWVIRVGLAGLAVIILVPNMPLGRVPSEDEGVFLYTARVIAQGGMPYRDVWDHKGPLIYLIDLPAVALGGQWGVWLVEAVVLLVTVVLSYRVLSRLGPHAAFFGTVAWVLAAPRLFLEEGVQTNFVEFFALPLQFGALALFAIERPAAGRRSFVAGVLAGAAAALKPTVVGLWLAWVIVLTVTLGRQARWRELGVRLALLAAGASLVVALLALWLAGGGALGEAIDIFLRYNLIYSGFASTASRLGTIAIGLRLVLPTGLAVVAVTGWILAFRGPRPLIVTTALVALPIELVLSSAGRGYHYYFLSWLPSMAVLAAYLVTQVERIAGARLTRLATVGALSFMAVYASVLLTGLATTNVSTPVPAAVAYLRATTSSSDRVLLWGTRAEVLEVAQRGSATRFVFQYGPFATRGYGADGRIDELIRELERVRPLLVIDASADSFVTPPLDRVAYERWSSIEPQYEWPPQTARVVDYVNTRYERVGTIPGNGWPVWRRRGP